MTIRFDFSSVPNGRLLPTDLSSSSSVRFATILSQFPRFSEPTAPHAPDPAAGGRSAAIAARQFDVRGDSPVYFLFTRRGLRETQVFSREATTYTHHTPFPLPRVREHRRVIVCVFFFYYIRS